MRLIYFTLICVSIIVLIGAGIYFLVPGLGESSSELGSYEPLQILSNVGEETLPGEFKMDQFSVWTNYSKAYLRASPHTSISNGLVEIEFISKVYEGNVTVVFGFDNYSSPKNPEIKFLNQTSGEYEFKPLQKDIITRQDNFKGKEKFYIIKDVPIKEDKLYTLRFQMNVKEEEGYKGKYDFAIYPSSYGNDFKTANDNGHLLLLDPWVEYGDNNFIVVYDDLSSTSGEYKNGSWANSWSAEGA